jgi:hypothetical protein
MAGLAVQAQPLMVRGRVAGPARAVAAPALIIAGLAGVAGVLAAHRVGLRLPGVRLPAVVVVCVVAAVLGAVCLRRAWRVLDTLDLASLTGGAQLAGAALTAAILVDPSLLFGVVEARRWRRVGRVRSHRFLGRGLVWTLVQADLRRQFRRRDGLGTWAALILVPYAVALAAPGASGPARLVAAYVAADRLCSGLRAVARSSPLRRALGGSDSTLRSAHLVVPAVGLVAWWFATSWVQSGTEPGLGWLLPLGVFGAVYRGATRKPMSYDSPALDTPFGLIQPGLLRQIFRGPDLLAVLVLAQFIIDHKR